MEYKIFIINQANGFPFNRGILKNIGFDIARREGFETFAFHDIDLLPEDDSCDYSFPAAKPVHLAARISSYEYKMLYAAYFGGVVLFSREQFERINGYANCYWGWGYEDDDLFSRCVLAGMAERSILQVNPRTFTYASFDGESTKAWLHPRSPKVRNLMNSNFTISLLLQPSTKRNRLQFPSFTAHYNQTFPLITRHSLPVLTHSQKHYFGHAINSDNVINKAMFRRSDPNSQDTGWEMLTFIMNKDEHYLRVYLNGAFHETVRILEGLPFVGNQSIFKGFPREYFDTPYVIGYADAPLPGPPSLGYFQGDIGGLTFWDRCLENDETKAFLENRNANKWQQGCVCDLEFTTSLRENADYTLRIKNATYDQSTIDRFQGISLPARRNGKYKNIDLRKEKDKFIENTHDTRRNEELLARFWARQIDPRLEGLSNLRYQILETTPISECALMYHVTFPGPQ